MASRSKLGRSTPLVLLVSSVSVEALVPRRGREGVGLKVLRFDHELPPGEALATFVASTLRSHRVRRRPVVLALGPDLVPSKVVELPALSARELERVMARRAAALVDVEPGRATFSAIALDGEDLAERRWLMSAMGADPLADMQHELRRLGFPARYVVPSRIAPFLAARVAQGTERGAATLVAVFEEEHCAIGLLAEGRLVHTSTLQGGAQRHLEEPHTAKAFVQELRGLDAFWRRQSRGESLKAVVVGGMEAGGVAQLAPAIKSALGDVAVGAVPSTLADAPAAEAPLDGDAAREQARADVLSCMTGPRMAAVDFGVELRPRTRTLVALATASALVFGTMALALREHFGVHRETLETQSVVLRAATADLAGLEARAASVREVEAMVLAAAEDLRAVCELGIPAEQLLSGVLAAFQGDAQLLNVSASCPLVHEKGSGLLRIRGAVPDVPGFTAAALARLEGRLGALPGVATVQVDAPRLDDRIEGARGGAGSTLGFSALLTLERSGAPRNEEQSSEQEPDA